MGAAYRYLIHAGDVTAHESFSRFISMVLKNQLKVSKEKISYSSKTDDVSITMFSFDPTKYKEFELPLVNGRTLRLRPPWTYKSPYMNSDFESKTITVTVGPVKEVYEFGKARGG